MFTQPWFYVPIVLAVGLAAILCARHWKRESDYRNLHDRAPEYPENYFAVELGPINPLAIVVIILGLAGASGIGANISLPKEIVPGGAAVVVLIAISFTLRWYLREFGKPQLFYAFVKCFIWPSLGTALVTTIGGFLLIANGIYNQGQDGPRTKTMPSEIPSPVEQNEQSQ